MPTTNEYLQGYQMYKSTGGQRTYNEWLRTVAPYSFASDPTQPAQGVYTAPDTGTTINATQPPSTEVSPFVFNPPAMGGGGGEQETAEATTWSSMPDEATITKWRQLGFKIGFNQAANWGRGLYTLEPMSASEMEYYYPSGGGGEAGGQTYTRPADYPESYVDANGKTMRWSPYLGTYDEVGYTAGTGGGGTLSPADQRYYDLQQQQLQWEKDKFGQQQAADKAQRLATLQQNPLTWLQYGQESGLGSSVQPWMLPLMPQEYGLSAGMKLPGTGGGGTTPGGGTTTPGVGAPAPGGGTTAGTYTGGGQTGGFGTVPGQGDVIAGAPGLLPGMGGTMPGLSVEQTNQLTALNRRIAAGYTGGATTLSLAEQQLIQQYLPGSWQAWLAQGGQSEIGSGGYFTPQPTKPTLTPTAVNPTASAVPTTATSTQQPVPAQTTPYTPTPGVPGTYAPELAQPGPAPTIPEPTPGGQSLDYWRNKMNPYGMANGGVVTRPTLAMLGEQGPEVVVPLSNQMLAPGGTPGSDLIANAIPPSGSAGTGGYQSTYPALQAGQLPWLMNPARQYQARMGPTSLQQYYGYEQQRTGASPQEQEWRLWSQAPPSGQNLGLQYRR